jgi:hypothetical protein
MGIHIFFWRTFGSGYTYEKPNFCVEKRHKDLAILSIAGKKLFPFSIIKFHSADMKVCGL